MLPNARSEISRLPLLPVAKEESLYIRCVRPSADPSPHLACMRVQARGVFSFSAASLVHAALAFAAMGAAGVQRSGLKIGASADSRGSEDLNLVTCWSCCQME